MQVTFNELAERELDDAAQYYEHEEQGLGAAFVTEIRRCVDAIANILRPALSFLAPSAGACANVSLTHSSTRPTARNFGFSL